MNFKKRAGICPHGRCKGHEPSWKIISEGKIMPNLGIFGIKRYLISCRCCGIGMLRVKIVQRLRCIVCGREVDNVTSSFALCECCGGKKTRPFADFED